MRKNNFLYPIRGFDTTNLVLGQTVFVAKNLKGMLLPTQPVIIVSDLVVVDGIKGFLALSRTSLGPHMFSVTDQFDVVGNTKEDVEAIICKMQKAEKELRSKMKLATLAAIAMSKLDQENKLYD